MDSRKVSLFATIAVIALVAVGIGFAYTAITTNQGNTTNAEYVTLVQDGTAAYKFTAENAKVYWDTENVKITTGPQAGKIQTKYTLADNTSDIVISGITYKTVALGVAPIQIKAAPQAGGSVSSNLSCTFQSTSFTYDAAAVFIVGTSNNSDMTSATYSIITANDTWSDNQFEIGYSEGAYTTKYVQIYYGYTGDGVVVTADNISGLNADRSPPATSVLNGAEIKFIGRTPSLNGATVQLTDVTVTATSSTISPSGNTTVTAAPNTGANLPDGGTWISLNTSIATVVAGANNTATVTAGALTADSKVLIVYKTGDGKFTASIEITVDVT